MSGGSGGMMGGMAQQVQNQNTVGTAGAPPTTDTGGQGFGPGVDNFNSATSLPAYGTNPFSDSTNTTTQQDVMGTQLRNLNSTGAGLNGLFNQMQTQYQPQPQVQQPQVQQQPTQLTQPQQFQQMSNVNDMYTNILGRAPDAGGLAYWQERADKGVPLADIQKSFLASDEFKNRPQQAPTSPSPQNPQQGQQGGKAGGFGQPQQSQQSQQPQQPPQQIQTFTPQVSQSANAQQANPYQVQNPYQGMLQNSYSKMLNQYTQPQRATPYQQQFQQQYNPLSYRPNMTQANASLSRVKPSVYSNDLATAQARVKELEDAEAARTAAAQAASNSSSGGG